MIGGTGVTEMEDISSVMHLSPISTVVQIPICTKKGRSTVAGIYIYHYVRYIEWLNVRRLNTCGYQKNSNA